KLWLQGAENGDATAQRVVGDFCMRGVGVERSVQEAERWLTASSNQGDTAAMVLLGGLILADTDNRARFPRAVELFRRAAERGNADAQYNLGVCLRQGWGVPADIAAAERSYRSAAERNQVSAQLALADLIAARATSDDERLEAMHWYRLAADNGNKVAKLRVGETRVGETEENVATNESGEPLKAASAVP
ncbi:MAG TPA: tetratricopeptide repeat protein, partial [Candidatus Binataceae bacterium]|nr:tetratricopeptide repeat protein [Candidatus Binataceae bacterium]